MEDNREKQQRKKRVQNGQQAQKMFSFRIDLDLLNFVKSHANAGRWINDLIWRAKLKEGAKDGILDDELAREFEDEDENPQTRSEFIRDYQA